jgi:hypothetical protein
MTLGGDNIMDTNNQLQMIEHKIFSIRRKQVMLDRDLAAFNHNKSHYLKLL